MCFVLYVGTTTPIARKEWRNETPGISVKSLSEREEPIRKHFSKPEVQYVGSTSGCGCDFGSVMFQNGGWPWWDDGEVDPGQERREQQSRQGLVAQLRATGEEIIELYGIWDGDFDFNTPPQIREEVTLDSLLDRDFRFKEQGFYAVRINSQ